MLRFLVTGTLRCGTAYTARVLNLSGIACGHGWVHTPDGMPRYPQFEILGDAAPLAAPAARDFTGLVLHQVRAPLEVIGALVLGHALRDPLAHGPEGEFIARHFRSSGDPLQGAMRYYVEWNTLCERHNGYIRYRVEELDYGLIHRVADLIGARVEQDAVARALAAVPRDFNTRYPARRLRWGDLPAGPAREALERMARRYGYAPSDAEPTPIPGAALPDQVATGAADARA